MDIFMVRRMMRVTETAKFKRARQWPLAGVAVWMLVLSQPSLGADKKSIEERTKIHRLSTTNRAVYDAFVYVNRIPAKADESESPTDFSGAWQATQLPLLTLASVLRNVL